MIDSRTACFWQLNVNDLTYTADFFEVEMLKLGLLGQNAKSLTDCSDVIPVPQGPKTTPHLPAGKTLNDIQAAVWVLCSATCGSVLTNRTLSAPKSHSHLLRRTPVPPLALLQCKSALFVSRLELTILLSPAPVDKYSEVVFPRNLVWFPNRRQAGRVSSKSSVHK